MSAHQMREALEITAGNIRSLGPAGALDKVPMPYQVWLRVVEDALRNSIEKNGSKSENSSR